MLVSLPLSTVVIVLNYVALAESSCVTNPDVDLKRRFIQNDPTGNCPKTTLLYQCSVAWGCSSNCSNDCKEWVTERTFWDWLWYQCQLDLYCSQCCKPQEGGREAFKVPDATVGRFLHRRGRQRGRILGGIGLSSWWEIKVMSLVGT